MSTEDTATVLAQALTRFGVEAGLAESTVETAMEHRDRSVGVMSADGLLIEVTCHPDGGWKIATELNRRLPFAELTVPPPVRKRWVAPTASLWFLITLSGVLTGTSIGLMMVQPLSWKHFVALASGLIIGAIAIHDISPWRQS